MRRDLQQVEREQAVLDLLFSPPPNASLERVIPEGTRLRAFYVIDRSGYLDISKEFLEPKQASPEAERLAVYALVNAIVLNSPGIDAVQILVEGRSIQSPWGWMDCSSPLGANLSLIH
jgi:spore germination protein GerM